VRSLSNKELFLIIPNVWYTWWTGR